MNEIARGAVRILPAPAYENRQLNELHQAVIIGADQNGYPVNLPSMTPEVFAWVPVSNNQALIAGKAAYILNSLSAYRSAQKEVPEIARDVLFVPALKGPRGTRWACEHLVYNYIIPFRLKNM
ncbi:hypothetical protein B2D07_18040 [Desulfococcus multivorans]|nr:hypothetical protein B2D07_18040 [Desulfococcus multivorans]